MITNNVYLQKQKFLCMGKGYQILRDELEKISFQNDMPDVTPGGITDIP